MAAQTVTVGLQRLLELALLQEYVPTRSYELATPCSARVLLLSAAAMRRLMARLSREALMASTSLPCAASTPATSS